VLWAWSSRCHWNCWPPALCRLESLDAVEQVGDEAEGGVVQAEAGAQPLKASHVADLTRSEPQFALGVTRSRHQSEGYEATEHVGMQACGASKPVEIEAPRSRQGVGHRRALGSNVETRANSWNNRRSSSLSVAGTMMRTSA
jgi:hypothetical protein